MKRYIYFEREIEREEKNLVFVNQETVQTIRI